MRKLLFFSSVGLLILAAGCSKDDEIKTYRVSKENSPAMPMTQLESRPSDAKSSDIAWIVPAGWIQQPPSTMRVGSFLIKGAAGQQADVSVIPLSGQAGGDLANINRWRGQINLEPISDAELSENSKPIHPGGRPMILVDFVSREPMIGTYKKRLIGAIYTRGERSWFFKMAGDDQTVEAAKPAFLHFLDTLKFNDQR